MPEGLKVLGIVPGLAAFEAGVQPGDVLVQINGQPVQDIVDYLYLTGEPELLLQFAAADGEEYEVEAEVDTPQDLGLELAPLKIRVCDNRCPFCFVDQMPKGFRPSLYLKDDDWRTSFLHGSYVTLTNLRPQDSERIRRLKVSPLYVSVHATDDEVRHRLLGNADAEPILPLLKDFSASGIRMYTQAVIVPGINDGEILAKTIADLFSLYPLVPSLSVVPVGLTAQRGGLASIDPVTRKQARAIVDLVERAQSKCLSKSGSRFVFAADELYLNGNRPLPPVSAYEDFSQIENGVGLAADFLDGVRAALKGRNRDTVPQRGYTWVNGISFHPLARNLAGTLRQGFGIDIDCAGIENETFGRTVNVTGLLTGKDIVRGLGRRAQGRTLILPAVMLRDRQGRTLDNMTPEEIGALVGAAETVCTQGGEDFVQTLFEGRDGFHV